MEPVAFPADSTATPGSSGYSGHSGRQAPTAKGTLQDLKLSEGSKLEVAGEKIGSHQG